MTLPIGYPLLERYAHHPVFVETGSFLGDGIQAALDAGYREVHSIELHPKWYKHCKERFKDNPNVHLHLGDSAKVLFGICNEIDSKITFWLDGHYMFNPDGYHVLVGNTAWHVDDVHGVSHIPLMEELEQISMLKDNDHIILIDDLREWYPRKEWEYTVKDLVDRIVRINPSYQFFYEPGIVPNDILVAQVI